MYGLNKTATVYTPHATTGAYTVLAKSGMDCRLAIRGERSSGATAAEERAELVARRRLLWDEDYTMPEDAQVEIDGERWNIQKGTVDKLTGLDDVVIYRRCDLVKVT